MDYLEPKETERLILRPLTLDDVPLLEAFYKDPRTTLYIPQFLQNEARQAELLIRKQLSRYLSDSYGLHALIEKQSEAFVGMCGLLLQFVNGKEELEIGYHLLPDHWGQGYATEAAHYFRTYAFDNSLSDSVISIMHIKNVRSQAVAERNGMKRESTITLGGEEVYIYRTHKAEYLKSAEIE